MKCWRRRRELMLITCESVWPQFLPCSQAWRPKCLPRTMSRGHRAEGHGPQWVRLWVTGDAMFLPDGVCLLLQRGLGDDEVCLPPFASPPPSLLLVSSSPWRCLTTWTVS